LSFKNFAARDGLSASSSRPKRMPEIGEVETIRSTVCALHKAGPPIAPADFLGGFYDLKLCAEF
jgi:hypothetical protein